MLVPSSRIRSFIDAWPYDRSIPPVSTYPAGVTLFRQDDPAHSLFLLSSGIVKVVVTRDDRQVPIAFRSSGALLGAAAFILDLGYAGTAVTMTSCDIRRLSGVEFEARRRTDLVVADFMQRALAEEARDQLSRSAALIGGDCRARLEHTLVELCSMAGRLRLDGSVRLTIDVTVSDLAELVLTTRERLSRLLSRLVDDGSIAREKGWFVLPQTSPLIRRIQMPTAV